MKKIVIIGVSGCGKTTLGKKLSKDLGIKLYDLDEFYWLENWVKRDKQEFVKLIKQAANEDSWIICGNASKYRHYFWPQADLIIWLDLPLYTLIYRGIKRGIKQYFTKEKICNGNTQNLKQLCYLVFYWILKSYPKRKKDYQKQIEISSKTKWVYIQKSKEIKTKLEL